MSPDPIVKPPESRADGGAAISVRNLRVNYGEREILHTHQLRHSVPAKRS